MSSAGRTFIAGAVGIGLLGLASLALAQAAPGDAAKGHVIFDDKCSLCHSMTENQQGPHLGGVVGRKAGTAAGADYTDAIKGSGLTWTPDKLDRFLTDPDKMVPGTAMPVAVSDPVERRDLIAYLASVPDSAR